MKLTMNCFADKTSTPTFPSLLFNTLAFHSEFSVISSCSSQTVNLIYGGIKLVSLVLASNHIFLPLFMNMKKERKKV